jgi:hypothetical protein
MEEAREQLELAEMRDGFLRKVRSDPLNRAARRSCPYTVWNDQSLAKRAEGILKSMGKEDIRVLIVSPSTEAGMPHTRAGSCICLPAYWPDDQLISTLQHELVHIDQRRHAIRWSQRLAGEGWTAVSEGRIPDDWVRRCRLNPDTCQERFWAWKAKWVALPVFEREDAPILRDIDIFWYDLETGEALRKAPSSYIARYGQRTKSEQEHPFELFAYDHTK